MKLFYIFSFLVLSCSVALADPYNFNVQRVRVVDSYDVVQKTVQFDPRQFTEISGFYQVGEKLQAEKQQNLQDEVNLLRAQLDILIKILQAKNGGTEIPVEPTPEKPAVPEPPKPAENTLDAEVLKILSNCANCHGDTKKEGGLQLVTGDKNAGFKLVDISLADSVLIHHRTNAVNLDGDARMPKGSPALSDDKVEILRQWLVSKAKKTKGE